MARNRRRRRRRTRSQTAAETCTGDAEPPPTRTSIHDLPDDLLEQVLLRVRTPFCLFRAMDTCKLWRRVIAGDGKDGLLHRTRSLHRPNHLLGHYLVNTTEPGFCSTVAEFVPFPARPAFHLRQRLSLDFLIDGQNNLRSSVLTDSRGGLLAFVYDNWLPIVCDPWTRQYRMLDEFPWRRLLEVPGTNFLHDYLGAFILDDGDQMKSSLMSSFSVLCVCLFTDLMTDRVTAEACVFSARDNGWTRWTVSNVHGYVNLDMDKRFVGRAGGSIFFTGMDAGGRVLLVIDEATGSFSTIMLPLAPNNVYNSYVDRGNLRVVNGGPGSPVCIVRLVKDDLKLKVFRLKVSRAHGSSWECMVESSVDLCLLDKFEPVCATWSWRFLETATEAAAANLVLGVFSRSSSLFFSLDVQTMKLQRATKKMTKTLNAKRVFPYELPWPQTISPDDVTATPNSSSTK